MNCPRCEIETGLQTLRDVEVDTCRRCQGMFLSRGELNRVAEPVEGDLEFSTLEGETFQHEDRLPGISCPACATAMKKVEFNIYTGIILDYCQSCGGFWLDGQELKRIDEEVRAIKDAAPDGPEPAMSWFAHFIWGLPR